MKCCRLLMPGETMKNKTSIAPSILLSGIIFCALLLTSCQQASTIITVGNGSGVPGSKNNRVEITLDNPTSKAKGIQVYLCDEGNYLSSVSCEAIGSASEFICACNELSDGCLNIILYSIGNLIQEGTAPIVSIDYTVSEDAPPGQCIDLSLPKVLISDEDNKPLPSGKVKGSFCFS